jgi:hypothetical protein
VAAPVRTAAAAATTRGCPARLTPCNARCLSPLQELCSLSKHLQLTQRQALWSKMQQLGLFEVLTKVIATGAAAVKLRATDILLSTLGHDPVPLRNFLTAQPGHELLGLLVREMLGAPDDSGLPEQIGELLKVRGAAGLRVEQVGGGGEAGRRDTEEEQPTVRASRRMPSSGLLRQAPRLPAPQSPSHLPTHLPIPQLLVDPETMEGAPEKSEFLEVFYERYMDVLVASVSGEREIGSASATRPRPASADAAAPAAGSAQQQQQQQQQRQQAEGGSGSGSGADVGGKAGGGPSALLPPGPVPASTIGLIVDLLCYCVQHHQVGVVVGAADRQRQ